MNFKHFFMQKYLYNIIIYYVYTLYSVHCIEYSEHFINIYQTVQKMESSKHYKCCIRQLRDITLGLY